MGRQACPESLHSFDWFRTNGIEGLTTNGKINPTNVHTELACGEIVESVEEFLKLFSNTVECGMVSLAVGLR